MLFLYPPGKGGGGMNIRLLCSATALCASSNFFKRETPYKGSPPPKKNGSWVCRGCPESEEDRSHSHLCFFKDGRLWLPPLPAQAGKDFISHFKGTFDIQFSPTLWIPHGGRTSSQGHISAIIPRQNPLYSQSLTLQLLSFKLV